MPDLSGVGGIAGGIFGGPIGAGIGSLAGSLVSGLFGSSQKRQGNQILANNPYPTYNIPGEIYQNKNLAQQIAGQGLPAEQYEQAMKNIQRQQGTAIAGLQGRRSAVGGIGKIVGAGNDASLNLASRDAQQRLANQQVLMKANQNLGSYEDKSFQWNQANKYNQNREYAMSLLGAGNQNIAGGIDKGIAGLSYLGAGLFGKGRGNYSGFGGDLPIGGNSNPNYYNGYSGNSQYGQF